MIGVTIFGTTMHLAEIATKSLIFEGGYVDPKLMWMWGIFITVTGIAALAVLEHSIGLPRVQTNLDLGFTTGRLSTHNFVKHFRRGGMNGHQI